MFSFKSLTGYSNLKLGFKYLQGRAPSLLNEFVSRHQHSSSVSIWTSIDGNCRIEMCKTAFPGKAIKLWNCLPTELKTQHNFNIFSRGVKSRHIVLTPKIHL